MASHRCKSGSGEAITATCHDWSSYIHPSAMSYQFSSYAHLLCHTYSTPIPKRRFTIHAHSLVKHTHASPFCQKQLGCQTNFIHRKLECCQLVSHTYISYNLYLIFLNNFLGITVAVLLPLYAFAASHRCSDKMPAIQNIIRSFMFCTIILINSLPNNY